MSIRSWLFVPGDSEAKLAKVAVLGADVVIVDLEDAVAPGAKSAARQNAVRFLEIHRTQVLAGNRHRRWVRINALNTPFWREDLAAIMPAAPRGIMVPKASGPDQLRMLAAELYELEQRHSIPTGTTQILPLVSETAPAALSIPAYGDPALTMPRLAGLTWGAEDLAVAIGAIRKRDAGGQWTDVFRMVRANVLLAAHARAVPAIDTLHSDFRDLDGLKAVARASYEDGFAGMLAIHPDQVKIINEAFTPRPDEVARALTIINAFEDAGGAGVVQVDGKMIDQPHLAQARALLERAQ
jgi:citrate lyase subunit beta / citryl-CoA lyase